MKYGLGDSLADYGFSFLEKLHSPIFLMHKTGTIKKVNEAGRKLLHVAHISRRQFEDLITGLVQSNTDRSEIECQRIETKNKQIKVISKRLESSDYMLVELIR
jgi:sensor histidine kinase regulating citrate/malate metabolism